MGNITVTIKLVGSHHNGLKTDAERMTVDFVDALKSAGHSVTHAGVTIGGETDLLDTDCARRGFIPLKDA